MLHTPQLMHTLLCPPALSLMLCACGLHNGVQVARKLTTMAALNWSTRNRSTAPSFSYLARHSAVLSLRPEVDGCSCWGVAAVVVASSCAHPPADAAVAAASEEETPSDAAGSLVPGQLLFAGPMASSRGTWRTCATALHATLLILDGLC